VTPAEDFDEATVLRFAASVERGSEHPLAAAIVAAAAERKIELCRRHRHRRSGQGHDPGSALSVAGFLLWPRK
jgi:cation transport ATPase